ncbi:MAG: ABC transporter permease [Clostridiaceae bacterium]
MSFINIFVKELKQFARNKRVLFMMLIFPILLITILGNALKNVMGDNETVSVFKNVKILYYYDDDSKYKELIDEFVTYGKDNLKITFEKIDNVEDGKTKVADSYNGFIVSEGDKDTIYFYKNQLDNIGAGYVEKTLNSFVERYNLIVEIYKVNPMGMAQVSNDKSEEYTNLSSINPNRVPSSIDYYSVAELTMIIMYLTTTMLFAVKRERIDKTEDRILITPVSTSTLILAKVLSGVVIGVAQCIIVYLFSRFVLDAYWGDNLLKVFGILIAFIFMNVMIGTGFAFMFKDSRAAEAIINILIYVLVALGGGYFPIESFQNNDLMSDVVKISPVYWANTSIFENVFGTGNSASMFNSILISLAVAFIFMAVTVVSLRRRGR